MMNPAVTQLYAEYLRLTDSDTSAAASLTLADVMQSARNGDITGMTQFNQPLTVAEAAKYLHIAPKTVYGLVSQGELGYHRIGRAIRFLLSDLQQYQQRITTTASRLNVDRGLDRL